MNRYWSLAAQVNFPMCAKDFAKQALLIYDSAPEETR
jgi:hypothetical protein